MEKLSAIWEEEQASQLRECWPELTPTQRACVFEQGVQCLGAVGAPWPLQGGLAQLCPQLPGLLTSMLSDAEISETGQGGKQHFPEQ